MITKYFSLWFSVMKKFPELKNSLLQKQTKLNENLRQMQTLLASSHCLQCFYLSCYEMKILCKFLIFNFNLHKIFLAQDKDLIITKLQNKPKIVCGFPTKLIFEHFRIFTSWKNQFSLFKMLLKEALKSRNIFER